MKLLLLNALILISLFISITTKSRAATLYSTGVTDWKWSSSTSWTYNSNGTGTCSCTPVGGDVVIIRSSDSISVPSNINVSGNVTVQVFGELNVTGFLDLTGTASIVNIYTGGQLTSNGSPSNKLRIGGTAGAEYTGTDGTLNGPWTISNGSSSSNSTLPVVFTSFTGSFQHSSVVLYWQTTREINNQYFEIQKSTTGKDFITIGKTNAGNVSGAAYSFSDAEPSPENYYRLLQVDLDGKTSYSSIIEISTMSNFGFTLFPNPAAGNDFGILFEHFTGETLLVLKDSNSKELFTKNIYEISFLSGNEIPVNLPTGIYFVTATNGSGSVTKKIIIL